MFTSEITYHRMKRTDVDVAVAWAAMEGWNPGLHDADAFFTADSNGFFLAKQNGTPVGCVSAVAYDDNFGFLGFYIVKKELRNKGIGMQLSNLALDYLGHRTIGADGVLGMLEKYAQIGLRLAHLNARYESAGKKTQSTLPDLSALSYAELERYDRRHFPAPRSAFLQRWISRPGTFGRVALKNGTICGYGVIRPCIRGFKIAPLFADTQEVAAELYSALSGLAEGQPVFLDIPVCNSAALDLVQSLGMTKVFETGRIYRGTPPELPLDNIYGITSFELG
jgi:GNAT superfamily N-acetyltransferase